MEYYYKVVDDPGKVNIDTRQFYFAGISAQCRIVKGDCGQCLSATEFSTKLWRMVLKAERDFMAISPEYPDGYFKNGAINFIGD